MHEASCHQVNSFVTLTYDEDHLPLGGSLQLADFQLFLKRLRKAIEPKRVRFFHCGEYGSELSRPHYHALLFGHDFEDKTLWADRGTGPVWRSEELERLWSLGLSEIGSVSFESAAYVARYCTKKVTGKASDDHYVDRVTGLVRAPEYATMSRDPGIGANWFDRFRSDVYPSDEVVARGRTSKPPRFYDQLLERKTSVYGPLEKGLNRESWSRLKRDRAKARNHADETPERLAVREVCAIARNSFQRRLEEC